MTAATKFCWIVLLVSVMGFSQDRAEFTRDKEFYIKGNATVLGNSILGKSASKSFDKPDKSNDEFSMRYIDIDNDSSTWSSSRASFSIPEDATIVYGSLMWTATYYGEESKRGIKDNQILYKKLKERAHNPQVVKLKLPNASYIDIRGVLIYDGENAKNRTVKSRAPYAYMANVTEALQGYHQGEITVANVAATQGKMNGGSSAGWLLYIVYEDNTEPFQYITTFYGLESIKKEEVEINFGSFKSSEDGELKTQITVGALEGDANLNKDQIKIYNPKSKLFIPLGDKVRPPNNFFNSSITSNEKLVLDRTPNSKNTLGFDIARVTLDKELNTTLANSSQGVKMQLNSRGDHYFLFFTAFQTTISEAFYKSNQIEEKPVLKDIEINSPAPSLEEVIKPTENVEFTKPDVQSDSDIQEPEVVIAQTSLDQQVEEKENKLFVTIPSLRSGFYIISNVFSNIENAVKWERTLISKGFSPTTFLRPDNGLHYVSLSDNTNPVLIYELLKNIREDKDLSRSWILKVNM